MKSLRERTKYLIYIFLTLIFLDLTLTVAAIILLFNSNGNIGQIKDDFLIVLNFLVFSLLLFLIGIIIVSNILKKVFYRIEKIKEKTVSIVKQNNYFTEIKERDEIDQLKAAVDSMAESLNIQINTMNIQKQQLFTVLNNMNSGVILIGKSHRIILVNAAIEKILNEKSSNLIGKLHSEAGQSFGLSELIDKTLKTGESIQQEINIYYPSEKIIDVHIGPIINEKDEIYGVVSVLYDITHTKRLEKIRREFVANVSHELRTPVTAIKGFTETLLDGDLADKETLKSFLEIIKKEADRLHRLIGDLLDLSKIEANKEVLTFQEVKIVSLIEETLDILEKQITDAELKVIRSLSEEFTSFIDRDRMQQVFINLLTNAISYTPKGGEIKIEVTKSPEYWQFIITDTGIGIPAKYIPRIFERFYRVDKARSRQSGGTGLGLAIVKHIVEAHNGTIQVESEVGIGSKFIISIPFTHKIN